VKTVLRDNGQNETTRYFSVTTRFKQAFIPVAVDRLGLAEAVSEVAERIVLKAERACAPRQAGDRPVEAIEYDGDEDGERGGPEVALDRLDDRVEAGEEASGCQKVGQKKYPALERTAPAVVSIAG